MSNARVGSPDWDFTGFTNYRRLFADPVFWQTVKNSFVFTFGSEALRLVIGLPMAFALNRTFKGKRLVQGLILLPFVIHIGPHDILIVAAVQFKQDLAIPRIEAAIPRTQHSVKKALAASTNAELIVIEPTHSSVAAFGKAA